jgi:molybdopterin converting factor small subunit
VCARVCVCTLLWFHRWSGRLQVIGKSCVFALNEEYIEDSSLLNLKDGDKLAVVPPISGG